MHRLCLENGIVCGADSPEPRPAQQLATRSADAAPLLLAVENNDEILLARVEKSQLLSRDAYEFFNVKIGTLLGFRRPVSTKHRRCTGH